MKIYSGKNLFLPAKTVFASPVFTMKNGFSTVWQKPANPDGQSPLLRVFFFSGSAN